MLKCKNCGAPLEPTPEDIILVCPYCGFPNAYDELFEKGNVYFVDSVPKKEILRLFWERMRKDKDFVGLRGKIQVVKMEGAYIPLWFAKVRAWGYVKYEIYEKKDGKKRTVIKLNEFEDNYLVCISGRKSVYDIAVEELTKKLQKGYIILQDIRETLNPKVKLQPLKNLSVEVWENLKLEFLNVELSREEAERVVLDKSSDMAKSFHVPEEGKLLAFNFGGEVEDMILIFYPLWKVYYDIEGGTYFVAYDGHRKREILALEPNRIWRKISSLIAAVCGVAIVGLFSAFFGNPYFWRFVAEAKKGAALILAFVISALYFGFELARLSGRKMSWDVRVEK